MVRFFFAIKNLRGIFQNTRNSFFACFVTYFLNALLLLAGEQEKEGKSGQIRDLYFLRGQLIFIPLYLGAFILMLD